MDNLKTEKHKRLLALNQELNLHKENYRMCADKLKQTAEYMNSAKKLLKLKSDDALGKFLS